MFKTKRIFIVIALLFVASGLGSCVGKDGGGQQDDKGSATLKSSDGGSSETETKGKSSEKGIKEIRKPPFSKETIEEIKKEESLKPEIIREPVVIPLQEEPPPTEIKEPSPESQNNLLYKYSQTPASEGIQLTEAPALGSNFTGLTDNNTVIPPDTMGAAGPNHLMETLNSSVGFFNKSAGELLSSVTLQSFWSSLGTGSGEPAESPFDPKVLYDQYSGSFITVTLGGSSSPNSWIMLGVSATSDPTGIWYKWAIDADLEGSTQTNNWADYPALGVDADNVYIAVNMFNDSDVYQYSTLWVIPKSQLLSGASTLTLYRFSNPTGSGPTLQPAHTFGTSQAEYIIHQGYYISGTPPRRLFRIAKITFSGGTPSWTDMGYIEVTSYPIFGFPDAPQLGSSNLIETNDSRLLNAVYRNSYIWTTHTVSNDANTKTEAAWYQIDPSAATSSSPYGTPTQQGRINDQTRWYYFPSIAVNSNSDVGIGFSGSSSSEYPSAYYTARASTDASGSMQSVAVLKSGLASYYKTFGSTRNRWGDYSATCIDPNDDLTFWTLQEYASTASGGYDRWGTWWGKFSISLEGDATAPSNTTSSDFINNGATTTNSRSVTLYLSATDNVGVAGYYASENSAAPSPSDAGWTTVSSTTSYSASAPFTLSSSDGTKTVYVWFKDAAGNVSAAVSDAITLSTTASDGGGNNVGSNDGCFIATAAYGSYLDHHVVALRKFRDDYLLTNPIGIAFVKFYYKASPPIAYHISRYEALRTITRWLLTPIVYGVKYPWGISAIIAGFIILFSFYPFQMLLKVLQVFFLFFKYVLQFLFYPFIRYPFYVVFVLAYCPFLKADQPCQKPLSALSAKVQRFMLH